MEQATAAPAVVGHAFGPSYNASGSAHTAVPAIVACAGVDASSTDCGVKGCGLEGAELLDDSAVDRRGSGLSDASDGENIADRLSTFTIRKQTSYR
ncbi:hypothetical protein ElyMa_006441300 [Elysia marginata]|uniref:Uncharacterized protein n=1 Tax=Elysia marginata TaxID=1093978 RepID=A0AAV4HZI3_9GAST|nr:hypothetical protein ElyMa_006441300 [Elysia marginata]